MRWSRGEKSAALESTAEVQIEADGSALVESSTSGAVAIPTDGDSVVDVVAPDGEAVGISVADVPADATASVMDGMTVFDLETHAVTFQPVPEESSGDVPTLFTFEGSSSPTAFIVDYDLPAGAAFVPACGGCIVQDASRNAVGALPAPRAKDANANTVPTEFALVGDILLQHVRVDPAATAFPVVADP